MESDYVTASWFKLFVCLFVCSFVCCCCCINCCHYWWIKLLKCQSYLLTEWYTWYLSRGHTIWIESRTRMWSVSKCQLSCFRAGIVIGIRSCNRTPVFEVDECSRWRGRTSRPARRSVTSRWSKPRLLVTPFLDTGRHPLPPVPMTTLTYVVVTAVARKR